MPKSQAIANTLLLAMPDMDAGFFDRSLVFMLEHNSEGAMGLTLTHPSTLTLGEVLTNLDMPCQDEYIRQMPVMIGGPVHPDRGFILHRGNSQWENTVRLAPDLSLTVSLDFLRAAGEGRIQEEFQVFLGYAGWGAGQLEDELRHNQWLFAQADHHLLFDLPPEARWQAGMHSLGFDPQRLSRVAGHA